MPESTPALSVLIEDGAQRLRRSGVGEPRRQAVRIWADLTESAPVEVFLKRNEPVDQLAAIRFQSAVARRSKGEPLPHVTGWAGFRRMTLRCDRRALIPRPETEGLVELVLERVRTGRVADIGTGSGCISLSLGQEGAFDEVIAVERSSESLALAQSNWKLIGGCVTLVQADLCAPLRPGSLDALVSNPPYLTAGEYASLDGSVRDWEPAAALVSGEDGMHATMRLLDEGRAALRAGGWLALEVDSSRAEIAASRASVLGWNEVTVHMDLFGRERYLLARRSNTR
jgi:release factor glutamine methyltransferase